MASILINIITFQIGWFACVLGAAQDLPWLGPLVALPIIFLHLYGAAQPAVALTLIVAVAILGSLFDQTLLTLGWIGFPPNFLPETLLPLWMTALWMLFATTLNLSLRWLQGRILLAILFGFIGGPLAYIAGTKLGAMQLLQPEKLLIALAIGWGTLMPTLLNLAKKLDGFTAKKLQKGIHHV
ncbi:MAG: DUF2878 domain-containing protein [Methylophilaceae bacterium]